MNTFSFAVRGIHLNSWAFNYPYTFRCWKEEDWRRYLDILAAQSVNLFFLWPFMEIMPVPLSPEDESYLQEVRRVVEYAQEQHGMEVWIMQSANRVAVNDCGVHDPRMRPYWITQPKGEYAAAGQVDLNPADPEQFRKIMQSRETLYRIVNNADGYCTIDNDPGGWPDSPLDDFMRIFTASRELLDRTNVHGLKAKLINWLWYGWGRDGWCMPGTSEEERLEAVRKTIRAMKSYVPEPWWMIAGRREYLPACAAKGVLPKTVYLPYGVIEGEPARPWTQIDFPLLREHLDAAERFPGLAGLMGNAQTPLLQFPHVYCFLAAARDYEYRKRTPEETTRELAGLVYPEQQQLLADCWMALAPAGRARIGELTAELERVVRENRLGQPGVLGRSVFPAPRQIADDLLLQMKAWTAFEALQKGVASGAARAECARLIEAFLDAALAWDRQHGWSAYWLREGTVADVLLSAEPGYPAMISGLKKMLGGAAAKEDEVKAFLEPIGRRLSGTYDARIVAGDAITPLVKAIRNAA